MSRGALRVTFVESDQQAVHLMRKNLTACGMLGQAELRIAQAEMFLRQPPWWNGPYDVVFADPPYADREALALVLGSWRLGLLAPDAVMVIEQQARVEAPTDADGARLLRRYKYGDTSLLLYGPAPEKASS